VIVDSDGTVDTQRYVGPFSAPMTEMQAVRPTGGGVNGSEAVGSTSTACVVIVGGKMGKRKAKAEGRFVPCQYIESAR